MHWESISLRKCFYFQFISLCIYIYVNARHFLKGNPCWFLSYLTLYRPDLMVLSTYPRIWLGVFYYFVGSGLKGLINVYMHVCCLAMFCMFCMYIVCICIYLCACIFVCVYIYICMFICVHICFSMYVLVYTFVV